MTGQVSSVEFRLLKFTYVDVKDSTNYGMYLSPKVNVFFPGLHILLISC